MTFLKNRIVLLILAGIVLAGIIWYSFLGGKGKEQLLKSEDLTKPGAVDESIVNTLLQLRAVSLSGTIFGDPAFMSLQDFGSQIVPEPVGRPNPFAPLVGTTTAAPKKAR